ncbi:MAG TPA: mechanosensitive ion channel domain-containing protein [Kineosporiaceae bacterium]
MQDLFDTVVAAAGDATRPAWWKALLDVPLKVAIILVTAFAVRLLAHRFIDRIAEGIATGRGGLALLDDKLPTATAMLVSPLVSARRQARARTTASVLRSATTAVVGIMAVLSVLQLFNVGYVQALASVSVVGIAVGLGAQAVIKDLIAGIFLIMEDQYGVGDVVDLVDVTGTVESVGLRVTRLRDAEGTVWYLRNGEVLRVGNRSQGTARAVLDVGLAPGEDVARAQAVLLDVTRELAKDEDLAPMLLDEPQVWGIESVTADAVAVRIVVRTQPLRQWTVARELRRRILDRFVAEKLPRPTGLGSPAESFGPKAQQ